MLAAAIEMLAGGVVLLAVAAGSGEFSRIQWSSVPATSWIALAYLIGPGSILAFTAYGEMPEAEMLPEDAGTLSRRWDGTRSGCRHRPRRPRK